MPYSPRLVANAFLYKANQVRASVSHMKLQKLVFFLHAWGLVMTGQGPVLGAPEAWPYGPVYDQLYHDLKGFGSGPVTQYLSELNPATGAIEPLIPNLNDVTFWQLVERVWERYGHFTAMQLSALTHEPGSPWDVTRRNHSGSIRDELMVEYYGRQLNQHAAG